MKISERFEKLCLDPPFFLAKQNNLSDDMTKLQIPKGEMLIIKIQCKKYWCSILGV
jgi:hypothetical protein